MHQPHDLRHNKFLNQAQTSIEMQWKETIPVSPWANQLMKRTILLLLLFSQLLCFSQWSERRTSSANSVYTSYNEPAFSGQCFNITLINSDTTPTLLRLGPGKRIENGDTVTLARIYPPPWFMSVKRVSVRYTNRGLRMMETQSGIIFLLFNIQKPKAQPEWHELPGNWLNKDFWIT